MSIYDEIEIEDMTYDPTLEIYHYPCPCGDRFEIGIADLRDGEEIAVCPSCSLMIRVVFEVVRLTVFVRVVLESYADKVTHFRMIFQVRQRTRRAGQLLE